MATCVFCAIWSSGPGHVDTLLLQWKEEREEKGRERGKGRKRGRERRKERARKGGEGEVAAGTFIIKPQPTGPVAHWSISGYASPTLHAHCSVALHCCVERLRDHHGSGLQQKEDREEEGCGGEDRKALAFVWMMCSPRTFPHLETRAFRDKSSLLPPPLLPPPSSILPSSSSPPLPPPDSRQTKKSKIKPGLSDRAQGERERPSLDRAMGSASAYKTPVPLRMRQMRRK